MESIHPKNHRSPLKKKQLDHIRGGNSLSVSIDLNAMKKKLLEEIIRRRLERQGCGNNRQDSNIPVLIPC